MSDTILVENDLPGELPVVIPTELRRSQTKDPRRLPGTYLIRDGRLWRREPRVRRTGELALFDYTDTEHPGPDSTYRCASRKPNGDKQGGGPPRPPALTIRRGVAASRSCRRGGAVLRTASSAFGPPAASTPLVRRATATARHR